MIYLNKYIHLHPFCTDPFRHHGDNKYIKGEFSFIIINIKLKYKFHTSNHLLLIQRQDYSPESIAMDLLCFDISLVPGTKLCPRCWSEIDGILNSPKEYEDSVPTLDSPEGNSNPHLPELDQPDLDLELTQVLLETNCKLLGRNFVTF